MAEVTFLGTGNFSAAGRYWNSFVIDRAVLVDPSPIALPHLRRCGMGVDDLDAVFISHFHADHTFGWPFMTLELLESRRTRPLFVAGPPGVASFIARLMEIAGLPELRAAVDDLLDIRYVEVTGEWQEAGGHRFRAVEVDHVPYLTCFGFLFDRPGLTVGYSGDTTPCAGLDEIARSCGTLILECNGRHEGSLAPPAHMDIDSVRALRERFPDLPFVLTHLGVDVDDEAMPRLRVPNDLETVIL